MDNLIVRPQPKTRKPRADLVQPSLLSLLPEIEDLPADPKPLVLRTQAAPNNRRQSLKRFQCPEGMNYCARCDTYKDVSFFHKDKKLNTGLSVYCKECSNAYGERYRTRRMHQSREKNYGITPEQYNTLHIDQGGVCAICGQQETKIHKGVKVDLCVDHDHETGKVRGLLCAMCNHGLGNFKDNTELLTNAIDYLQSAV